MTADGPAELPFELRASGVIAALRAGRPEFLPVLAGYLWEAGIGTIEIPVSTVGVESVVSALSATTTTVGVGDVVDVRQAETVVAAGASFVSTAGSARNVVRRCIELETAAIPVLRTRRDFRAGCPHGAAAIMVPAQPLLVGTAARGLQGVPVIASGNIDPYVAGACIEAGASGVAAGGWLLGDAAEGGSLDALTVRAHELVAAVAAGLGGRASA